jgi:site-specific recombinase XerD
MPHDLIPKLPGGTLVVPALIADAGPDAATRFAEFFTANIQNRHTRRAYFRNATEFLRWCEARGIDRLATVQPIIVAAYIEELGQAGLSKPSIKQKLATIRMLFDWLVIGGQIVAVNPAASVRGPKHIVKRGKTPILPDDEAKTLLASIDTSDIVGLRDKALVAVMLYTFARVGAVVKLKVGDYYPVGKRWRIRLDEKGGRDHEMPANHKLEEILDAYRDAAGIAEDKNGYLFRSAPGKAKQLTTKPMRQEYVYRMLRRRCLAAGIKTLVGCHSCRATGITNYMRHGGTLERAQAMAGHSSSRTTSLYNRVEDDISLEEVEKIRF